MRSIAAEIEHDPELVKNAPHTTRTRRVDETSAARHPVVRWLAPEPEAQAAD